MDSGELEQMHLSGITFRAVPPVNPVLPAFCVCIRAGGAESELEQAAICTRIKAQSDLVGRFGTYLLNIGTSPSHALNRLIAVAVPISSTFAILRQLSP
jgi:hypothetical protein